VPGLGIPVVKVRQKPATLDLSRLSVTMYNLPKHEPRLKI
jgi:hypothetical protein